MSVPTCKNGHGQLEWKRAKQAYSCSRCGYVMPDDDLARVAAEASYGIVADGVAEGIRGRPTALSARSTVDGYARKSLSRQGSRGTGMAAAQVLTGYSLADTLGTYVVPEAPADADGATGTRAELVGTLKRFIAYLKRNGILEDIGAPQGHHRLHKYAYIAQGLGMRLGYDFDFLENGAFSSDMEVDLFELEIARGGTEPFGSDARASGAFLDLVRGRDDEWLQVATFAVRDRLEEGALERFLARPRGIIGYDGRTARGAFGDVDGCVRGITGGRP